MFYKHAAAAAVALAFGTCGAFADSISPLTYEDELAMGESVTIQKTVTIAASGPTDALIDVMFVFDTTGSMGSAISGAKTSANAIISGLGSLGDVQTGAGQYDDPGAHGVLTDLTSTASTTVSTINSLYACYGSCGGDYEELGWDGIAQAAEDASWRPGSNRFIVAFGDSLFKAGGDNQATAAAALAAKDVNLIGISYSSDFSSEITALGGTPYASSTDPTAILNAIISSITSSFATYSSVTVGDLGGGDPLIDVSVVCTGADIGTCSGDTATGAYDRTVDRTFTFDVTFTRTGDGTATFSTFAIVDKGIVASERDRFTDGGASPVPLPAAGWMLLAGLGGLAFGKRRKG